MLGQKRKPRERIPTPGPNNTLGGTIHKGRVPYAVHL